MPPPCKQVSHRSPSQSAPERPAVSWPCVGTRLETESQAQKATIAAGLAHHIPKQQLQIPQTPVPNAGFDATAGSCYGTVGSAANPELLRQMTQLNPQLVLGHIKRAKNRAGPRRALLFFSSLSFKLFSLNPYWRVRTTVHAVPFQRGGERGTKAIRQLPCERRDLPADWRRRGRPRRTDRTQWAGGNVKSPRCLMGLLGAGDLQLAGEHSLQLLPSLPPHGGHRSSPGLHISLCGRL